MDNWTCSPEKNQAEPMEDFPMASMQVGDTLVYNLNPITKEWILVSVYDTINKKWVDV